MPVTLGGCRLLFFACLCVPVALLVDRLSVGASGPLRNMLYLFQLRCQSMSMVVCFTLLKLFKFSKQQVCNMIGALNKGLEKRLVFPCMVVRCASFPKGLVRHGSYRAFTYFLPSWTKAAFDFAPSMAESR